MKKMAKAPSQLTQNHGGNQKKSPKGLIGCLPNPWRFLNRMKVLKRWQKCLLNSHKTMVETRRNRQKDKLFVCQIHGGFTWKKANENFLIYLRNAAKCR